MTNANTTISTTPTQALRGSVIGVGSMAQCSACTRSIGEASEVALRAYRRSSECRWTVAQIVCSACIAQHGTIHTSTTGTRELILTGKLVLHGDCGRQEHYLAFWTDDGCDAVLDYSGPNEGSGP